MIRSPRVVESPMNLTHRSTPLPSPPWLPPPQVQLQKLKAVTQLRSCGAVCMFSNIFKGEISIYWIDYILRICTTGLDPSSLIWLRQCRTLRSSSGGHQFWPIILRCSGKFTSDLSLRGSRIELTSSGGRVCWTILDQRPKGHASCFLPIPEHKWSSFCRRCWTHNSFTHLSTPFRLQLFRNGPKGQ